MRRRRPGRRRARGKVSRVVETLGRANVRLGAKVARVRHRSSERFCGSIHSFWALGGDDRAGSLGYGLFLRRGDRGERLRRIEDRKPSRARDRWAGLEHRPARLITVSTGESCFHWVPTTRR